MHIWLARHAEAVHAEGFTTDFDRRLSETGHRQAAQLGRWLKAHEPAPELILHSPLKRAAETAELLREELGSEIDCEESHVMEPGMSCDLLLSRLTSHTHETVLCVGHQPDIGRCLSELVGGGRFMIHPGTVACVAFPQIITPGAGQLRWMMDPGWF